ncbi:MAG: hypothetical protein K0T99_01480, partial [Alphaproteobacteria bacterium]|nr:hypothetical protein [Alphaproteobacteria bacterium]
HYAYQFKEIATLQANKTIKIRNYNISLKKIDYSKINNYLSRKATIEISENKKTLGIIYPEIRFYPIEKTFTIESGILHIIKGDIYVTLGELNKDKILIEFQFKPFIYLLWIGSGLMFFSILLYFIFKYGYPKILRKT